MAELRLSNAAGRATLAAAVLASGMAFLDSTIVNVALPTLGEQLSADLSGLQWTVNGYTLMLAAFVLFGGSLGDRFGRRRIFLVGVGWFALASLACALAPNIEALIGTRILQGAGAALLTPGSLAILLAAYAPGERAKVIGAWSGLAGVATAVGPFIGGWLIDAISWRAIFYLNIPIAAAVVWLGLRYVREGSNPAARYPRLDIAGALLGVVGLAGLTYGLIAAPKEGFGSAVVWASFATSLVALFSFVALERRRSQPGVGISDREGRPRIVAMLPPSLFASRLFGVLNIYTLIVYAALGGLLFFLVIQLQTVAGFSALAAGVSTLPMTLIMLAGSARSGALATRIGPRTQLFVGPLLCAAGTLLLLAVGPQTSYWRDVLPGTILFGLGMVSFVTPLTAAVLAAVWDTFAGMASGVNNAAARAASLLAVATLPLLVGLAGAAYANATAFDRGYHEAMLWCAGLLVAGALTACALGPLVPGRAQDSSSA